MTSKGLDNLARKLAAPMPRRRALRLVGGALATAAIPGALRSTAAEARPAVGKFTTLCNPKCNAANPVKCVCPTKFGCFNAGCGMPGSATWCRAGGGNSVSGRGTPGHCEQGVRSFMWGPATTS